MKRKTKMEYEDYKYAQEELRRHRRMIIFMKECKKKGEKVCVV